MNEKFYLASFSNRVYPEYDIYKDIEPPVTPNVVETDVPDPVLPLRSQKSHML